jgi:hypothetical protein
MGVRPVIAKKKSGELQVCLDLRGANKAVILYFLFVFFNFTPFSPQFHTILSHRYNYRTGSGEMKVESHASSDTQPNQAALLLN